MTKPTDDLEAVRVVAEGLEGFDDKAQEASVRWAREKACPSIVPPSPPAIVLRQQPEGGSTANAVPSADAISPTVPPRKDLKTFVAGKKPRNDVQFAATVAYFHRFEGPQAERKN